MDVETLFLRLFAASPAAFWLDAGPDAVDGWSILGDGAVETDADAVRAVPLHPAAAAERPAVVPADEPGEAERPPFTGGWVGWLDYESGAERAGAPVHSPAPANAANGTGVADAVESPDRPAWIVVQRAVAVDHAGGRVFALAPEGAGEHWCREVAAALADGIRPAAPEPLHDPPVSAIARHRVPDYLELIERCRAAIARGDAYQLCLTTRFRTARPTRPLDVYRRVRAATPAHHGGLLRVGERWLLSASPEQFLSVGEGEVRTSPIKGTRPRSASTAEDARLAAELQADVKERAENVMIVDLMRNDLSRVCRPGSVQVPRLWEVQSYPAVHQLVSTVSGRLRDGIRFGELCDATFPAGSMTGAPKLSAMTILHALEGAPRGVYSGCFGFVGVDGRVDLAMVIRSIVVDAEGAWVGAGGGITWLSQPHAEAAEVATKARAPLAALGASLPAAWAALDD